VLRQRPARSAIEAEEVALERQHHHQHVLGHRGAVVERSTQRDTGQNRFHLELVDTRTARVDQPHGLRGARRARPAARS
jgi:hypothetical protein